MVEVSSLEEALCRARFDHPHRYRRGSTASSEFAPEPIEHRLFSLISQNWRGEPLVSHEVIVNLISATTTRTGLKVRAKLDPNACPAGVKVSEKQAARIQLSPDAFHGEWNSTIHPNGPKT